MVMNFSIIKAIKETRTTIAANIAWIGCPPLIFHARTNMVIHQAVIQVICIAQAVANTPLLTLSQAIRSASIAEEPPGASRGKNPEIIAIANAVMTDQNPTLYI